jgi:hypothetical protein
MSSFWGGWRGGQSFIFGHYRRPSLISNETSGREEKSGRFTPPFRPISGAQKFQSPTAVAQNLELGTKLPFSIPLARQFNFN